MLTRVVVLREADQHIKMPWRGINCFASWRRVVASRRRAVTSQGGLSPPGRGLSKREGKEGLSLQSKSRSLSSKRGFHHFDALYHDEQYGLRMREGARFKNFKQVRR